MDGNVDVVVTDGFTGNIDLKTAEGFLTRDQTPCLINLENFKLSM